MLNTLSRDILGEIFSYFSPAQLAIIRLVNTLFKQISDSDKVWKYHVYYIGISTDLQIDSIKSGISLKQLYIDNHFSFDPKTLCTYLDASNLNNPPIFESKNRRVIRQDPYSNDWWNVQIPVVLTKGKHYFEFTVIDNCVTIGVVDEYFMDHVRKSTSNVEIGSDRTYSFGYAFTGNLANCGTWIYKENDKFKGGNVVVGMYIDMDKQFIQYYCQGILQKIGNHIHPKYSQLRHLEIPLKLIPTVTLYYTSSSIQLNMPPKYDIKSLEKFDVLPHGPTLATSLSSIVETQFLAQEKSNK